MNKSKTFVGVKFRAMCIAATFSMLVEYTLALTDKIIAGHILGEAALAALTLADPMTLIIAFISCVLSAGAGMTVSAELGRGDRRKAGEQFSQTLILALGFGLIISFLYLIFNDGIVFALAGDRPEAAYVNDYFRYVPLLPVPMLLNAVFYPIVLYQGGEKYCNYSAVLSIIGNMGLSFVLAFTIGMKGISLATVIGSWAGLVPLIGFMFTDKGRLKFRWHLSLKDIRGMGVYSIGNSITYLYMAVFQACMNMYLLSRFNTTAIVVFTGVVNLIGLFAALSDGIGDFLLPMLNMYRGEGNVVGERNTMQVARKASFVEGLGVGIVILVFANLLSTFLGVDDPSVRGDFAAAARIYALCAPIFYVINIYVKYYLYTDRIRTSLLLSFCLNLVLPLAFGLLGGAALGMTGIWIGISASRLVLAVCAFMLIGRQEGSDGLCMFLDQKRMRCQHCWNAELTEKGIGFLMENAEQLMLEKGISREIINKVLLAMEESQMAALNHNKNNASVLVECTLYLEDTITLVMRNTGIAHNAVAFNPEGDENDLVSYKLLSLIRNKSYNMVNGSNRLIFKF